MAETRVAVSIIANDKTAKGVISAQRNLDKLAKSAGDAAGGVDRLGTSRGQGVLKSMARTFSVVEKASDRAFGGSSPLTGAIGRLGVIKSASAAVGEGLGEAGVGAGILSRALAAAGTAAAAAAATIAVVAAEGFKLDGKFTKSTAALGRLSNMLGVSTKDLQEFQGAGERVGVGKDAVTQSVATASQTIYDAVRGKNGEAQAMLGYLGIKARRNRDGSLDKTGMMFDIMDAAAKQQSADAKRQVLDTFGMGGSAFPLFSQGSRAVRADMADVAVNGVVQDPSTIAMATRRARTDVLRSQLDARRAARHDAKVMMRWAGVKDELTSLDRTLSDLGEGKTTIGQAVATVTGGVNGEGVINAARAGTGQLVSSLAAGGSRIVAAGRGVISGARGLMATNTGQRFRNRFLELGLPAPAAAGLAANIVAESRGRFNIHQSGGGPGYGLAQWEKPRQRDFAAWAGHGIEQSTEDEQIAFIMHELFGTGGRYGGVGRRLLSAQSAKEAGELLSRYYEGPKDTEGQARYRSGLADNIDRAGGRDQPLRIVLEVHGMPAGAGIKAKSGQAVAIAHAMPSHM
ncbi:MAG: hypothetical protein JO290_08570 [Sphingomonadaceae bacterium]|nr:hypothetical protein [Sphingomonadaceae bacterium]